MGQYSLDNYGDSLYGPDVASAQASAVRSQVGLQWDIALANVGLKLAPGNKAYDKHAAQTFSFNPKSMFKQGDGAALNPRDLYYWNRLEHSRWDGGETFEPWAPDPSQQNRNSVKYADSRGFDVTDPHKLSHLRELATSPSYEFVVGSDSPLAYWLLSERVGSPTAYDQEFNATPGQVGAGVTLGITPGPIVKESLSVASFDGVVGVITTANKVPFASGKTPLTVWSLESWVNPGNLPQASSIFAFVGSESSVAVAQEYSVQVLADSPYNYWKLNEVAGTTAADSGSSNQPATTGAATLTGAAGLVPNAVPNYGIPASNVAGITAGYVSPGATSAWSMECWFKDTGVVGDVFWHTFMGMTRGGGDLIGLSWKGNSHNLGLHIGGVIDFDTGFTLTTGTAYYVAVTWSTGGPYLIYVNGTLVATLANATNPWTYGGGTSGVTFGQFATSGVLSKPAIYSTQLSADRVYSHFVSYSTTAPGGFAVGIGDAVGGPGSKLVGYFPGATSVWVDSGYTFATESQWYHVVMTCDVAGLIRFYVNGVQTASTATPTQLSANANAALGASYSPGSASASKFFTGLEAQVSVYNTQLSLTRIQAHYNQGIQGGGAAVLTAGQSYAKFIELYSGDFYANQLNTNIVYSTDGGQSWSTRALPDATTIAAIWSKGSQLYVATANDVYLGDKTAFANIHGANPAIAGVTAGLYYSGQIYAGIGTSLYYIDPATGIKTQLYNTQNFTITFIEAFAGKVWFGGVSGRQTKVWTWTNNTLPPSAANGVGAQVQDGTIPYGFVVRSSLVYLNMLLLGGTICGDSTSEGQGTVYYITPAGQFGQLCILGPLMNQIRGTGYDYGVRSMWGAEDKLWIGASHGVGIARYDWSKGAFSKHVHTDSYGLPDPNNQVIAVAYFVGRSFFAVKKDGNIWREATNKAPVAWLEHSEFYELPFTEKLIDGIEGTMSALNPGEGVEVKMSFDSGVSWQSMGIAQDAGSTQFDFQFQNVLVRHWRSRVYAYRGSDPTKSPEIYNVSTRFAPKEGATHEWLIQAVLPAIGKTGLGGIRADQGAKVLHQLWASKENGSAVDFIDRDGVTYKVLVIEMKEEQPTQRQARVGAQQLRLDSLITVELLEVQRIG